NRRVAQSHLVKTLLREATQEGIIIDFEGAVIPTFQGCYEILLDEYIDNLRHSEYYYIGLGLTM
ncbi:hypothetical protein MBANPS3_008511, partial [Mucor bainieri]